MAQWKKDFFSSSINRHPQDERERERGEREGFDIFQNESNLKQRKKEIMERIL